MTAALKIAQHYFELSNQSNFREIEQLFTDTTTYSSATTGIYVGKLDIMAMQRAFHNKFATLHWDINTVEEVKPGIVLFDYDFSGTLPGGETITSSGLEYVIVHNDMIQHIEIRTKS